MKILVADANATFRKSLCRFLKTHFPSTVIKNSNTQDLVREVREFSPEIIILEMNFEHVKKIRRHLPGAQIIVLTPQDLPEYVDAGRKCGADHVFCKDMVGKNEIRHLLEIISREVPGRKPHQGNIREKNRGNGV